MLLLSALLLAAGCTKDGLTPMERKLEGTWRFDKVTRGETFSFHKDNITERYSGVTIQFRLDRTVSYVDVNTNEQYEGNWELRYTTSTNGDGSSSTEYFLDINMSSGTGELKTFLGTNASIGNKRINFNEYLNNTFYYTYVLRKQ